MKKATLILLLSLTLFPLASNAQRKGYACGIWTQIGASSFGNDSELKTLDVVVAPGYAFNRYLFALARVELNVGLFDKNSAQTYRTGGTLGAELGVNLLDVRNNVLSTSVAAGNTLGNLDWSFWYADWGLKWSFPSTGVRAMLGLGVRYLGSETSRFDDYCNFYVCLGFTFN